VEAQEGNAVGLANVDCAQILIDLLRFAARKRENRRGKKIVFWSIHPGLEGMIKTTG